MTKRRSTHVRIDVDDQTYTPFDRVESRPHRLPELLSLLLATAGMVLESGIFGIGAGLVLVALWTRLRVEFVFATGAVLFAGIGGDLVSTSAVLAMAGLSGLLAVDLAHTWQSVRPVGLFFALAALAGVCLFLARAEITLHWLGLGLALAVAATLYGLRRYELLRLRSTRGVKTDDGEV